MLFYTLLNDGNASLPTGVPQPQNFLNLVSATPAEVELMLKSLQLGKAAGPDTINNRILKELAVPADLSRWVIFSTIL